MLNEKEKVVITSTKALLIIMGNCLFGYCPWSNDL